MATGVQSNGPIAKGHCRKLHTNLPIRLELGTRTPRRTESIPASLRPPLPQYSRCLRRMPRSDVSAKLRQCLRIHFAMNGEFDLLANRFRLLETSSNVEKCPGPHQSPICKPANLCVFCRKPWRDPECQTVRLEPVRRASQTAASAGAAHAFRTRSYSPFSIPHFARCLS